MLAGAIALAACQGGEGRRASDTGIASADTGSDGDLPDEIPRPAGFESVTETQLLTMAELPNLYARHRDVAMICAQDATRLSPESAFPECDVVIVAEDGSTTQLGLRDVRNVQRLADDHLLIVRRDLEMVVADNAGNELYSLGRSFVSPHVMDDGLRVLAIAYADEVKTPGSGYPSTIDRVHAFTGERETVIDDPGAYAPYDVPGSDDIVFVSGRDGLASLWLHQADGSETKISNRATGYVDGKGWAPVPVHELAWLPHDPTRAIYAAVVDGHHELWVLDTLERRADRIGDGRMPARAGDGSLLVIAPDKAGLRAVVLPEEVLP